MSETRAGEREQSSSTSHDERGQLLLELSNAVVRIVKQFHGRGPTKASAHLSADVLTVILEGGLTRSEQTLMEHGHDDEVAQSRAAMQESIESEMRAAVETILERRVRSFMSANDPGGDLQAEVFVLERRPPAPDEERDLVERARRAREGHREVLDEHRALRAEQVQSRRGAGPPDRRIEP
jgi:uncharacterized protein YbcI